MENSTTETTNQGFAEAVRWDEVDNGQCRNPSLLFLFKCCEKHACYSFLGCVNVGAKMKKRLGKNNGTTQKSFLDSDVDKICTISDHRTWQIIFFIILVAMFSFKVWTNSVILYSKQSTVKEDFLVFRLLRNLVVTTKNLSTSCQLFRVHIFIILIQLSEESAIEILVTYQEIWS